MVAKNIVWFVAITYLLSMIFNCPDWQASGNMTDYLPTIRGFIDDAIDDNLDETTIAKNISDRCNAEWDRFWFVGAFWMPDPSTDVILYGYAFRSHWYWHNNYNGLSRSFVIWKDYTCDTQVIIILSTLDTTENNVFSPIAEPLIGANPSLADDIWELTKQTMDQMASQLAGQFQVDASEIGSAGVAMKGDFSKANLVGCSVSFIPVVQFDNIDIPGTSQQIFMFGFLVRAPPPGI